MPLDGQLCGQLRTFVPRQMVSRPFFGQKRIVLSRSPCETHTILYLLSFDHYQHRSRYIGRRVGSAIKMHLWLPCRGDDKKFALPYLIFLFATHYGPCKNPWDPLPHISVVLTDDLWTFDLDMQIFLSILTTNFCWPIGSSWFRKRLDANIRRAQFDVLHIFPQYCY